MNHNKIIDALGGTVETAKKCEVSKQVVSGWRKRGIPLPWLKFLRCRYPDIVK